MTQTRVMQANLDRVGDLCWTFDVYVKLAELEHTRRPRTLVIGNPGDRARPFNRSLFKYWRPYLRAVTAEQRLLYAVLFRATARPGMRYDFKLQLQSECVQGSILESILHT